MLNYPSSGDIIRVKDIRQRSGCRAYRVFNHYIDKRKRARWEDGRNTVQVSFKFSFGFLQIAVCKLHKRHDRIFEGCEGRALQK